MSCEVEKLYDEYSPMLFGIAIQLCVKENDAEKLVINTFVKLASEDRANKEHLLMSMYLIRLLIKTAREQKFIDSGKGSNNIQLFTGYPMIRYLLLNENGFSQYCTLHYITPQGGLQRLRHEFNYLRSRNKANEVDSARTG